MSARATPGVVAILAAPDGRVLASVAEFELEGPGGCSLFSGQRHRAEVRLALAVVREGCADWIVKTLDTYDCLQIVNKMITQHGYIRTIIPIGHGDVS